MNVNLICPVCSESVVGHDIQDLTATPEPVEGEIGVCVTCGTVLCVHEKDDGSGELEAHVACKPRLMIMAATNPIGYAMILKEVGKIQKKIIQN